MMVAGSMIGSGIYIVAADMSRLLGSPGWLLLAWVVTGMLTMAGALSYGELASMMPRAGGQYVYLREALSPMFGFLYGWTLFLVIQTGTARPERRKSPLECTFLRKRHPMPSTKSV